MKNTSDLLQVLSSGGLIGMISNKNIKKSKRYILLIICLLFYLALIGLCIFGIISNLNKNLTVLIILSIITVILIIDLIRFIYSVISNIKAG
ncbi:MAG: hypothetical protein NC181_01350 [Clostridium sp.]|nr:hypothetical protein [Clostridium sp.]MCM1443976.1 hypothetical protein [Candidatus Amulumruptor caecigallinarius]